MNVEDHIQDSIATVLTWDVEPEEFADTVNAYARLCAGVHLDDAAESRQPSAYVSLQF